MLKDNRYYLLKYLNILTRMNNTTESKLSKALGHDRTYIHITVKSAKDKNMWPLLHKLSTVLNVPLQNFKKINKGNYTPINKLEIQYRKSQSILNKHNYLWDIRKNKGLTDKEFAKKLGTGYLNARRLETVKRPNINNLLKFSQAFNISFINLAKHFKYSINDVINAIKGNTSPIDAYLKSLRNRNHLTQQQVANKLGLSDKNQSHVSEWERPTSNSIPKLNDLIKLSRIYNIPLINLLKRHPKYSNIELHSPAYKLLKLCKINNISVYKISKMCNKSIDNIINHLCTNNSHMDTNMANKFIKIFNLPKDYFGVTTNTKYLKSFSLYKNRNHHYDSNDIGYRLNHLRIKYKLTYDKLGKRMKVSKARAQQLSLVIDDKLNDTIIDKLTNIFPNDKKYLLGNNIHWLIKYIPSLTIGALIKSLEKYHNLKSNQLAKILDISITTLNNYIKENKLGLRTILRMSYYFNVSLYLLLKRNPKYKDINKESPSYKILKYCSSNGISINKFSLISKIPFTSLRNIINTNQSQLFQMKSNFRNKLNKTLGNSNTQQLNLFNN